MTFRLILKREGKGRGGIVEQVALNCNVTWMRWRLLSIIDNTRHHLRSSSLSSFHLRNDLRLAVTTRTHPRHYVTIVVSFAHLGLVWP